MQIRFGCEHGLRTYCPIDMLHKKPYSYSDFLLVTIFFSPNFQDGTDPNVRSKAMSYDQLMYIQVNCNLCIFVYACKVIICYDNLGACIMFVNLWYVKPCFEDFSHSTCNA